METKKISEIIEEYKEINLDNRKKLFKEKFKKYLKLRYKGVSDDDEQLRLFAIDFNNQENVLKQIEDETYNIDITSTQKKLKRYLTETENIPREIIIYISFVLVSQRADGKINGTKTNGLEICNDLLQSFGYYRFPAPSLLEMFYAYAFLNKLSLDDIYAKYKKYRETPYASTTPKEGKKSRSTTYLIEIVKAIQSSDDNPLFKTMQEISNNLILHAKSTSDFFIKSWNQKIDSLENQSLSNNERANNDKTTLSNSLCVDFYTMLCSKYPKYLKDMSGWNLPLDLPTINDELTTENGYFLPIIKGNTTRKSIDNHVLDKKYKEYKKIQESNNNEFVSRHMYQCWMDYVNNNDYIELDSYREHFEKHTKDYNEFSKKNIIPKTIYIEWRINFEKERTHYDVEDYSTFQLPSLRFRTLHDNIKSILDSDTLITREGFLLWLLYNHDCFDAETLSSIIAPRYDSLNPDVYFDKFVIMSSSFRLYGKKIIYTNFETKEQYEVENDIGIFTDNNHIFRKSIVSAFVKEYSPEMAVGFIDNQNFAVEKVTAKKATKKKTSK